MWGGLEKGATLKRVAIMITGLIIILVSLAVVNYADLYTGFVLASVGCVIVSIGWASIFIHAMRHPA